LTSPKFSNKLQLQKLERMSCAAAGKIWQRRSWDLNNFQNFPEIPKFSSGSTAGKLHKNYII